jgi:hypothetical protein
MTILHMYSSIIISINGLNIMVPLDVYFEYIKILYEIFIEYIVAILQVHPSYLVILLKSLKMPFNIINIIIL